MLGQFRHAYGRAAQPTLKWVCTKCGAKMIFTVPNSLPQCMCSCGNHEWLPALRNLYVRDYF